MVLLDDEVYKETKQIVLGNANRSPLLIEFADWFMRTYSAKVLNIEFSRLKRSASGRYRLYVILDNTEDYKKGGKVGSKEENQKQIAAEFQRLAIKHQFATEEQLRDLFVTYNDFSEEAKTEANWRAIDEVRRLVKSKYPTVWDVISMFSRAVVFYYADSEIALNKQSGMSEKIIDDYYSVLRNYDELNYFTRDNLRVRFDSKENLDKNYAGSLAYYIKEG